MVTPANITPVVIGAHSALLKVKSASGVDSVATHGFNSVYKLSDVVTDQTDNAAGATSSVADGIIDFEKSFENINYDFTWNENAEKVIDLLFKK